MAPSSMKALQDEDLRSIATPPSQAGRLELESCNDSPTVGDGNWTEGMETWDWKKMEGWKNRSLVPIISLEWGHPSV